MLQEEREANRRLWSGRVAEFEQSNMTLKDWCEAQGFLYGTMRYWQGKLRSDEKQPISEGLKWVPLTPPAPVGTKAPLANHAQRNSLAQVTIGKCVVDIPRDFQPDQLYSLLKVLDALC